MANTFKKDPDVRNVYVNIPGIKTGLRVSDPVLLAMLDAHGPENFLKILKGIFLNETLSVFDSKTYVTKGGPDYSKYL